MGSISACTGRYRTLSRGLHALIGLNVSCRRGMCDEDWAVVFGIAPKVCPRSMWSDGVRDIQAIERIADIISLTRESLSQ